jgi:hypothetical protein
MRFGKLAKCAVVLLTGLAVMCPVLYGAEKPTQPTPKIFIDASPSFATALTAAMVKKHVPVIVVEDKASADYILQSAAVDSKAESTGAKFARCIFADCIGINGYSEVSVRFMRVGDSAVVWAYQVRKGNSGPLGVQSLSEAIAKHLRNDYLRKLKN